MTNLGVKELTLESLTLESLTTLNTRVLNTRVPKDIVFRFIIELYSSFKGFWHRGKL
jgi:hypothetical protein